MSEERGKGIPSESGLYFFRNPDDAFLGFYCENDPDDSLSFDTLTIFNFSGESLHYHNSPAGIDKWNRFTREIEWIKIDGPKWGDKDD